MGSARRRLAIDLAVCAVLLYVGLDITTGPPGVTRSSPSGATTLALPTG
jgi:hypothetical protein